MTKMKLTLSILMMNETILKVYLKVFVVCTILIIHKKQLMTVLLLILQNG